MGIATKIDITPADLKTLQALLKRYIPQTTVWAFGSRVKFTNKPSSDLDLVAFTTKEQNTQVSLLKDAIEEAMLPYRVDLLCWHEIPENFKKNIEQQYVLVQQADTKENSLPKKWKTHQLNEVLEIKYGKDHKHLANGDIPLYGSGGIMRYVDTPLYEKESILIPRKGTLSNLFYLDKPFWSVDTMFYTKIKEGNNGKYLYYLLKSMDLASMNVGSAVPSLTTEVLNKVEINVPDEDTQKEIAQILTSIDDKIELNLQMNQTLEAMAQAIFKEWFVDFKFPGFDGQLVDGLPKGWRMGSLGEIVDVKGGTTPSTTKEEYWNGEFYWTTPKDLSNIQAPVLIDTERKITELGVKQISSGIMPKGTLLLSSRAPIGYIAISQVPISINQGYIAIQGKLVSNLYMLFWLKQNMDAVKSKANGSTFQEISKSNFREIETTIPSKDVLKQFDEMTNPFFEKIVDNVYQIRTLTQTRDTLLPKLMSGKIVVV